MDEYPKIETLYDRDDRFKVRTDALRRPEFALPRRWVVTEKIDGTNIRVGWSGGRVTFAGRTDRADIPRHLLAHLEATFTADKLAAAFEPDAEVVLFGEGYGEKIQGNPLGRLGVAFRLFDVWVNGWWLERDSLLDVAGEDKLAVPLVPYLGEMSAEALPATTEMLSLWAGRSWTADEDFGDDPVATANGALEDPPIGRAEGIVARTEPLLFTRDGKRLMWKLKFKDFR